METAVLGGGCFWCVEALLKNLRGVHDVVPGYCGGETQNPNYSDVKSGVTGHIEVVKIKFDNSKISFEQLFDVFMNVHDPTQEDGQGEDIGSQYVSAVFIQNQQQRKAA